MASFARAWVSARGFRRWLVLLLVLAVVAVVAGPGADPGRDVAARRPGHGPGQLWGDAADLSHVEADGRGNVAEAKSLQSKYPPIAGQPDPSLPAGNEAHAVEAEAKQVKGFDKASSRELPDKRGRSERTFANTDGTLTTEFGEEPMNYQLPDGSWQPIDTSLVPQGKGWRNAADSVHHWLAPSADADQIARLDIDEQHQLAFGVDGARASAGKADGNAVVYPDVRPGADLKFEVTASGLKESVLLHSADAPTSWLFPLKLEGLKASIVDGSVTLTDEQGAIRARIPQGFMVDSNFDEHIGNGATSFGVHYELVDGKALRMDLDTAWLRDPARVFPVTVDPPVDVRAAAQSMYVQRNSNGPDYSRADGELRSGHATDSQGNYTAASYLDFPGVESALRNHKIFGAQLGITNWWSWSCNARPVTVHPVLQGWSAGPGWSYPGPASGGALNQANFAHGYIPRGSSRSACPTATETIDLGWAGRDLVQRWVNGQQANFGLSVRSSETDVYGWKKYTGAGTANPPRLAVTHSPYDATYRFDNPVPNPPVTRTQGGRVKISVTNLGADTWTTANYALAYRVFSASGSFLGSAEAASLPADVPRGGSVTLDALIQPTAPGAYRFEFSMIHRNVAWFTDFQVAPAALALNVLDVPPVIKEQYPPNGYSAPTLTPSLWAKGVDIDAPPTGSLQYRFEVCQPGPANCFDSGRQPSPVWTVPAGRLQWGKSYLWRVFAWDGTSESPALPFSTLLTAVPQPDITAHLGNSPYGGGSGEFDPQVGNYTTSAIDATVSTVGPQLSVVRTYNSLDPRRDTAFGAGWASHYDMRVIPDADGSGNVVVTYPDGQQVRFGANLLASGQPDQTQWIAPPGRFAVLVPTIPGQPSGGWSLADKSGTVYVFGPDGKLREINDNAFRRVALSYGADGKLATATNQVSNRSMHFTWTGSHVSKVETDPVGGAPLAWTYGYDGDRLTSVCDPNNGCTHYDYTAGTHYRSAVIDSKPDAYWRFGERAGTDAMSQIALNLGADKARYSNVTLGTQGVLPGTDDPAATFNGTSSAVVLPDGVVRKSRELTVELWFKTTSGGPLFGAQDKAWGTAPATAVPMLYVGNDGKLRGQFWIGSVNPIVTTGTVTDGNWHHVVLTSSLSTQTLYLDGAAVGTRTGVIDDSRFTFAQVGAANALPAASWPQWGTQAQRSFNGVIDEVSVYQHPLGLPVVRGHFAARTGADSLTQTTLPSGKLAAQLTYDTSLDRLSDYVDRNGGLWRLGAPVTTGDPTNIIRTARVTDPGGRAHFYDYDPVRGRILRYLAPLGMDTRPEDKPPAPPPPPGGGSFPPVDFQGARSFDYDDAGFQNTITDENASTVTFTHDQRGNITSRATCRTGPTDCQTTYYEYFPAGQSQTDPRLDKLVALRDARSSGPTDDRFKTAYSYTSLGLLQTQTTADTAVVRHTYTGADPAYGGGTTPAGLVATSTDPRGAVTRYAYFSNGDLAEVREPSGLITRYTYDSLGRRLTSTVISDSFPSGVVTTTSYDKLSHPATVTAPAATNAVTGAQHTMRTTTSYDQDGNPTQVEQSDVDGGDQTRVTTILYTSHNQVERITDAEGGETSFGYDPFGNRTRVVNANGVQYEYAYTARNTLAEVRLRGWNGDPAGAEPGPTDYLVVNSYAYDLAGQLVRDTDAMGHATRYRYYTDGLLRQVIAQSIHNPDGTTRNLTLSDFSYDAAGNLTKQTAAGGLVTTFETDAVGRRTATTHDPTALARRTALRYDLAGNVTQVSLSGKESNTGSPPDSAAEVVDYGYDLAGRQTSQTVHTGTEDLTTTWGYDQRGLITSVTDPRGTVDPAAYTTNLGYDQLGRPVSITSPPVVVEDAGTQRPVVSTGYDTFGNPTESVNPNGQRWQSTFDKLSRLTTTTQPGYTPPGATQPITATARVEYDALGQVKALTDPRGAVTRYNYDQMGRTVEEIAPDPNNPTEPGGVWSYTYTRTGQLLSITDPMSGRAEATYDDLGRQITATQLERYPVAGTFTGTYRYDDAGNLTSETTPTQSASQYAYDLLGQLTRTTSAAGVVHQLGYDRSGRAVKNTDAAGRAHRIQVDLAGRPVQEQDYDPQGALIRETVAGFDRAGHLASLKDPLGHTTTFDTDAGGRLTRQVEPVSATESITTTFGYDADGNRTRYTDGRGNTTRYTLNPWGLPESVIEPATAAHPNLPERTWTTGYDAGGNPVTLNAPGGVQQVRTFNGLNKVTRIAGSGAQVSTPDKVYGYDPLGRLASSSAPGGTDAYTYNDRGALLTTTGPSGVSSFSYDADGNAITRTDAAGTASYTWLKDRLATVRDGITGTTQTLGYDTAGLMSTVDYGSGRTRTYTYDNVGRPATDTLKQGSTAIAGTTYGFDNNDRLTSKTTTGVAGAGANTYGYDFANRLTSWNGTGYGWDAAGNRTSKGNQTASYDERNRLLADGTSAYSYTPRGTLATRTTGASTEPSSFDAFDRLASQGSAQYTYDSLDRVATRNGTQLAYSGATNELASDGATKFARGPGNDLLALQAGSDQRLMLSDQHNDVVGGFSPTGTLSGLADSVSLDPFGTPTATGGTRRPIGYQGDYTDPDTGQVNMTARWYNPGTGAFTSRDNAYLPNSPSGASNRYTYTGGSPLNHTDPTGHEWVWECVMHTTWPPGGCIGMWIWHEDSGGAAGSGSGVGGGSSGCGGGGGGGLDFGNPCCNPDVLMFGPCDNGPKQGPGPKLPGTSTGGGVIQGPGKGKGGKGRSPARKPAPRPDPSIAARAANRAAAMNNPMPIPQALLAPHFGDSSAAPVSSAPDVPSHSVSDFRNPVDDVNKTYQELQQSLTVPSETLLGQVEETLSAPSELTPVNFQMNQPGNCSGDPFCGHTPGELLQLCGGPLPDPSQCPYPNVAQKQLDQTRAEAEEAQRQKNYGYHFTYMLDFLTISTAEQVFNRIKDDLPIFMIPGMCKTLEVGRECSLLGNPVRIEEVGTRHFQLVSLPGHIEGADRHINFTIKEGAFGTLWLEVRAWGPSGNACERDAVCGAFNSGVFANGLWWSMAQRISLVTW